MEQMSQQDMPSQNCLIFILPQMTLVIKIYFRWVKEKWRVHNMSLTSLDLLKEKILKKKVTYKKNIK